MSAATGWKRWSLAWGTPPPRPVDDYDAVIVFGGAMHADQDDRHPWLRDEDLFIQRLLGQHVPLLGICLGAQLIAKAAGARGAAGGRARDRLARRRADGRGSRRSGAVGVFPRRFKAFQWHFYAYDVPAGAVELARSRVCPQAFRLGDVRLGRPVSPRGDARGRSAGWIAESPEEVARVDRRPAARRRPNGSTTGRRSAARSAALPRRAAERLAVPA